MTQQEKQIKLAEHCFPGFQWRIADDGTVRRNIIIGGTDLAPNYFGDLNAIHEVEKALTEEEYDMFYDSLRRSITHTKIFVNEERRAITSANSTQRAEALGITLGLWKEGE